MIFCIVCEEYISASEVNEHSQTCVEKAKDSRREQAEKLNNLNHINEKIQKINQLVFYLMGQQPVYLSSSQEYHAKILEVCKNLIQNNENPGELQQQLTKVKLLSQ